MQKLLYILIWSICYSNIVSIDDHQLPITLETLEQLIQKETDFDSDRYRSLLLIQSQWPMIEDWHQKSQETFKRMSYIRSIGKDRSLWTQQVIKKSHGLFERTNMVIDEWNNVSFQILINKGLNGSPMKISQFNLANLNFKRAKMFIDLVAILTFMLCFHQEQVLSYHQSVLNEMEPSDKRKDLTLLFSNEKQIHLNLLGELEKHQIEQPGDRLNIKNQQLDERMKYHNEEFNNIRLKWNDLMSQKLTTLFISQTETPSQQFEEIVSTSINFNKKPKNKKKVSCSHSPSIKNKVDDNSNCNQISTIKSEKTNNYISKKNLSIFAIVVISNSIVILATRFILHRFRSIHSKNKKDKHLLIISSTIHPKKKFIYS